MMFYLDFKVGEWTTLSPKPDFTPSRLIEITKFNKTYNFWETLSAASKRPRQSKQVFFPLQSFKKGSAVLSPHTWQSNDE
jgi:hypothetical protein